MLETIYQIALVYAVLDIIASVYVMVRYRTNLRSRRLSFISGPTTIVNTEYSEDAQEAYDEGYDVGYDKGYSQGHHEGRNEGYDEGYEQGKEDSEESEEEMKPEMKQAMNDVFGVGV